MWSGRTDSDNETALGAILESTALVMAADGASIALAALTWRLDRRLLLLLATVAFTAVFAVFDVDELVHQIQE